MRDPSHGSASADFRVSLYSASISAYFLIKCHLQFFYCIYTFFVHTEEIRERERETGYAIQSKGFGHLCCSCALLNRQTAATEKKNQATMDTKSFCNENTIFFTTIHLPVTKCDRSIECLLSNRKETTTMISTTTTATTAHTIFCSHLRLHLQKNISVKGKNKIRENLLCLKESLDYKCNEIYDENSLVFFYAAAGGGRCCYCKTAVFFINIVWFVKVTDFPFNNVAAEPYMTYILSGNSLLRSFSHRQQPSIYIRVPIDRLPFSFSLEYFFYNQTKYFCNSEIWYIEQIYALFLAVVVMRCLILLVRDSSFII